MAIIEKTNDYINGDVFENGINNTILSNTKNIFLFICNENGDILAASDIIGGSTTADKKKIFYDGEVNDQNGGGILRIGNIDSDDTKTYVSSEEGEAASLFALAEWSKTTDETSGDITKKFPDVSGEVDHIIYLVGHLDNNPIIGRSTKFRFNEANINFGI